MEKNVKIYVAGHTGLVGSAFLRVLAGEGYSNILTRTHQGLDLTRQEEVEKFFETERPQYVILTAAKVGGIQANISYPAQFIYENLAIQTNVIHSSYKYGVKKLLFFGSACSYPRECPQPMKEEYLLSGRLEPTNESYAVAKISGIKMCGAYNRQYGTNFVCAIPANTYGPNDNFNPETSHVIPALIRKFHEAKTKGSTSLEIWGTGNQRREFIYVGDVASASLFLMENYDKPDFINVGSGKDVTIKKLASVIKKVVGYRGGIIFNASKPDGIPRKLLDVSKLQTLGWNARTELDEGITKTYEWYIKEMGEIYNSEKTKSRFIGKIL
jgi:GDP-L-fucose synthase